MTAEVAVLSRSSIALAADSAVTSGGKTYESANKLFTLSKYHPVGAMVYGSAAFMGMPWEVLIKDFRETLKDAEKNTIREYAEHFFDYVLQAESDILDCKVSENFQAGLYRRAAITTFDRYSEIASRKISAAIDSGELQELIDGDGMSTLRQEAISELAEEVLPFDAISDVGPDDVREEVEDRIDIIKQAESEALNDERHPLSSGVKPHEEDYESLERIVTHFIINAWHSRSGVVFAGYGAKEYLPKLIHYEVEAIYNGKLKKVEQNEAGEGRAAIFPFAQREMVDRIITAADPRYESLVLEHLRRLLRSYAQTVTEAMDDNDLVKPDVPLKDLEAVLRDANQQVVDDLRDTVRKNQQEVFIDPIVENIDNLPKSELAVVAETLVNITSFKRKMSGNERETVGGPVDVAVISKGDGFTWIKRKHYFNPDLNHHFFENYFKH